MKKPLEGLLVVEMTSYWAATTTARFLSDMGARVIRVETPPIGDFCRYYGRSMGMPTTAEENPIHDIFNGGKECVALNLKEEKDQALMHRMLARADVFITSTRTAGLKKLGLDWETLHARYPKLVMGQVTGYGSGEDQFLFTSDVTACKGCIILNTLQGRYRAVLTIAENDKLDTVES